MAGGIDWFRWHHGSVTDPKFQLVAKKSGARLGDVLAVWAYLLEIASAATERGRHGPIDGDALDCMLDMKEGAATAIVAAMVARNLTDGECITSWDKRQPKREDDTAAERKRKQRERDHELALAAAVTECASRTVTQCHDRGEESREEEIKKETHTPVEVPPAPLEARPGAVCVLPQQAMDAFRAMRMAGISDGHAGHPDLLALVSAGALTAEFQSAAADAVSRGKGFAYAIGTLKRQRINAASSLEAMHKGAMPAKETPRQKAAIDAAIAFSGGILNVRRAQQLPDYIDADSNFPALG